MEPSWRNRRLPVADRLTATTVQTRQPPGMAAARERLAERFERFLVSS